MSNPAAFTGSIPKIYHRYLGPLLFEPYARDMVARVGTKSAARILELACGTGIVTRALAAAMPRDSTLTATDLNPAMLDVAKEIVGPDPRVKLDAIDACTLPYADRTFDTLVCQYGVMFFPDKIKSMREARRVLVPGGRYLFNVWDSLAHNPNPRAAHETLARLFPTNPPQFLARTPYGWSDRAEIERVVRAGGFAQITVETIEFPSESPSAEDAARGWVEGSPVFAELQERGMTDPAPIREAVASEFASRFGRAPCRTTMRAHVVTAW